MIQFLNETLILFGDRKEEILDNKRVEATGGRTCCDNALGIEKENSAVLCCDNIVEKHTAFGCNIRFAEDLANVYLSEDTTVSPVVIFLDVKASIDENQNVRKVLALSKYVLPFSVRVGSCFKTGKHEGDFRVFDTRKQFGPFQYWKIIFHT